MTAPLVRRLVPSDAPAYRALMLDGYARHPDAFTSSVGERAALPITWWEGRLSVEPVAREIVFGAFEGDTLAGVAGLSFETREKARHKCDFFGMYVAPAFRKLGLGGQIVDAAIDAARQRDGVRLVQLTVTEGNVSAQALYERVGFVPFGVEPMAVAVDGGFVSKVHMWLLLSA
ncbi:GNAT family N-acetyltransferase [Variovorax rhizosphaerae]|uniref:GNAT family N-acetyltransferase n=1 Tax=Variovorax rhizosphaerae TaxID=1836200 RepID=A0ABU8WMF5_9BURK